MREIVESEEFAASVSHETQVRFHIRHRNSSLASQSSSGGILEQSMGAKNRVGIGLSYRPERLHRLAESILWNRFLGS